MEGSIDEVCQLGQLPESVMDDLEINIGVVGEGAEKLGGYTFHNEQRSNLRKSLNILLDEISGLGLPIVFHTAEGHGTELTFLQWYADKKRNCDLPEGGFLELYRAWEGHGSNWPDHMKSELRGIQSSFVDICHIESEISEYSVVSDRLGDFYLESYSKVLDGLDVVVLVCDTDNPGNEVQNWLIGEVATRGSNGELLTLAIETDDLLGGVDDSWFSLGQKVVEDGIKMTDIAADYPDNWVKEVRAMNREDALLTTVVLGVYELKKLENVVQSGTMKEKLGMIRDRMSIPLKEIKQKERIEEEVE